MSAHDLARQALRQGDAPLALTHLADADDGLASWLRGVCAAHLGDPLRATVALRTALRQGALPQTVDVALPFARAVIDDDEGATRAWLPMAKAAWEAQRQDPPASLDHLAWELCVLAATELDTTEREPHARAGLVLALGTLKWRMHEDDEAIPLLRGAQDAAEAIEDADVLHGATLLLAEIMVDRDDLSLAADLIDHGRRKLSRFDSEAAEALQQDFSQALASRTGDAGEA